MSEPRKQRFPLRPTERRVEQDDIELLLRLREKLQGFLGMNLHLLRQLEHLPVLLQHGGSLPIEFAHYHRFCVTGRAFKTQCATAGKQIQHGQPAVTQVDVPAGAYTLAASTLPGYSVRR